MTGAAVEATGIAWERLCPGTSIKFFFPANSPVEDCRGRFISAGLIPILSAAAFVIRGCTAPGIFVAGTGLALNTGFAPFVEFSFLDGVPPLLVLTLEA
jgi:hypothetical protein